MLEIFSSRPDHPLANPGEANRILNEIASGDSQQAIEEATTWIESVGGDDGFSPGQRLSLLLKIDEAAAPQLRRLARDYIARSTKGRTQELHLWDLGHGYCTQLFTAYLFCLTAYRYGEEDSDAINRQLHLLYGRLVSSMGANLKWDQFRYGAIDPDFWGTVGNIYLAAVEADLAQKSLILYPNQSETTIEAEYLKVLVFQSSSMDKLTPLQIEVGERLIAHFLPFFKLVSDVRPENVYWVDAGKPQPPSRLVKRPQISPTVRFFYCTRAEKAVAQTIQQLTSEGRVPPAINLGAKYDVSTVIPVLTHFLTCWGQKLPVRSAPRRHIDSEISVVHAMAAIHRRLSGHATGGGIIETWTVEDVSLGGLGAHATVSRDDWIRINALIAIQLDSSKNWLLGVVRRYVRTEPTRGFVGIETISKAPRAVLADSGGIMTEAILIDALEVGGYARMVLAPSGLEEGIALLFSLDGKNARLYPRETLVSDPDYVIASFIVQSYS